jgi:hypothetical protein
LAACFKTHLPAIAAATAAAIATATTSAAATATAATTAATVTAAATTTTSAAAATTTTTALSLLRFVDSKGPAVEHRAVHFGDRLLGLGIGAHRNEAEPARPARFSVGRDVDIADLAEGGKSGANSLWRRVERQIANVETITHVLRPVQSRPEESQNPAVQSAAVGSVRGRGGGPRPRVVATSRDT